MRTKWGESQTIDECGHGIQFISTAGHGGYKVPTKLNRWIPVDFRAADGYYEEDCQWAAVDFFLSAFLTAPKIEQAKKCLINWEYAAWEKFTGTIVDPAESCTKRDAIFKAENALNWVGVSASGDWKEGVPKGYVEVFATLGGERSEEAFKNGRTFYVPSDVYDTRGNQGYVVPPAYARVITGGK